MKYILFVYMMTITANGGVSITSAEFDSLQSCNVAAEKIQDEWETILTQKPKTMCVKK